MREEHITAGCFILLFFYYSEFSVGALENVLIDMQGMGFLNSMMNKVNLLVIIRASDKIFANLNKIRSKIFILAKDAYFLLIKNKVFALQVVLTMVNQNLHTVLMAGGKEVMRREFEDFSLLDQMYSGFKIL